jgi:hypothetical protein
MEHQRQDRWAVPDVRRWYNSMLKATTMNGNRHTVEALPIEKTVETLKEHRVIK